MHAALRRFADSPFGVFAYFDLYNDAGKRVARFCAMEDDWLDNLKGRSCIPAGTYQCQRRVSPKFGEVFEVMAVPDRSAILIHAGNTEEDVEGCILLGEAFGAFTLHDEDAESPQSILKWGITGSRLAVKRFMALTEPTDTFELNVVWEAPGGWRP